MDEIIPSQLAKFFEISIDLFCIAGLDGYFKDVNASFTRILGWSEKELLSKPLIEFVHPDDHKRTIDQITKLSQGGTVMYFENRFLVKDSPRSEWFSWTAKIDLDKKIYAIGRSITKQKNQDKLIREMYTRYDTLLQQIPSGVFQTDPEGKCIYINRQFTELTGSECDTLSTDSWMKSVHPDDRDDLQKLWKKCLHEHEEFTTQCRFIGKNSETILAVVDTKPVKHVDGHIECYIGTITDSTALLQARDEMLKFQLAVENVSDQIVITDDDAKIIYANPSTKRITGFDPQDIIGQKAGKAWGDLMGPEYYKKLWDTIKNQKKSFSGEITNKRKNGQQYEAEIFIVPILDKYQDIKFFVAVEHDITQQKEDERVRSEFLSIAAHQLRTPLGSMRWNLEMLLAGDYGELGPDVRTAIDQVYQGNVRLVLLVNDLLNTSRIDQNRVVVKPENVKVEEIIQAIITELEPLAQKTSIKINFENKATVTNLFLDPIHFREAITNLLSNAIKYSRLNGVVEILLTNPANDSVEVKISDSGIGISRENIKHIFTKFYRANNAIASSAEGSGLGLYVVKKYVEMWNGKIWFESEEGKGSKFFIRIPISQAAAQTNILQD